MDYKPGDIVEFVGFVGLYDGDERWLGTRYKVLEVTPSTPSMVRVKCIGPKFYPGYKEGSDTQFSPEKLKLVKEDSVSEQMIPASKVKSVFKKYKFNFGRCLQALEEMGINVEPHFEVTLKIPASYCDCETESGRARCAGWFLLHKFSVKPTAQNIEIKSITRHDWSQ